MNTKTFYSTDDQEFIHDDIGSVIDALSSDSEVSCFYYAAEFEETKASKYVGRRIDELLEQADECVFDETHADGYDNAFQGISLAAKAELQELIANWADRHVKLNVWTIVGESRKVAVTQRA